MIGPFIRAWERRLAAVDTRRVVHPFEWGAEWIGLSDTATPLESIREWARAAVVTSESFFTTPRLDAFDVTNDVLRFSSAVPSRHPVNDTVVARVYRAAPPRSPQPRRAVVVLPQWNSDPQGHVGLCRLFARFGITAARLTLPYHDERRPPHLQRADYIVSPNIGRTLHANRQAVLDARRVVDWLEQEGFERIGIVGTSLGSCPAFLTMAHEPRIRAGAFNHISPFFADVVWRGLSTEHVRAGLEGHITLDDLRECWSPISPQPFVQRVEGRRVLLVYATHDLSFPVDLSRDFIAEFKRLRIAHRVTALPCGHYSTGKAPFKYLDGYTLTKFLVRDL